MTREAQPKSHGRWIGVAAIIGVLILSAVAAIRFLGPQSRSDDPTIPVALGEVVSRGAASDFNVLLITLDTTRPDRLGCYGYKNARTPTIDALINHGVRFDDAVTSAPITLPSHATILTGLYPPTTGVRANGVNRLAPRFTTLAEALREHEYDTAAFVSCFVLDRRFGVAQGFDTFEFQLPSNSPGLPLALQNERRADHVTSSAIRWLRDRNDLGGTRPFLLWVHYFDPHYPYDAPIARLPGSPKDPYDAEIAFVDLHVKRLLASLDKYDLRKRTLIAVASDHGESLNEHDEPGHAVFVYESTMHAVLILSCPALFERAYRVDDRVVGLIDVYPTVLDLLGLPAPENIDGQSLLADQPSDRALYIETFYPQVTLACSPLRGMRRHEDKFILAPRPEYYDLNADPDELENRISDNHQEAAELEQLLAEFTAGGNGLGDGGAVHALSAEEIQRLEALGYAGPSATRAIDVSQCDPKDRIACVNRMSEVHALMISSRTEEAIAIATDVMDECEGWVGPVRDLAQMYSVQGRWDEAAAVLRRFVERYPDAEMLYRLANIYLRQRSQKEFEEALVAAETLDPEMGAIAMLRGDWFLANGEHAKAIEHYQRAIDIDPARVESQAKKKLADARRQLENRSTP